MSVCPYPAMNKNFFSLLETASKPYSFIELEC